jgi:hypothetical protein
MLAKGAIDMADHTFKFYWTSSTGAELVSAYGYGTTEEAERYRETLNRESAAKGHPYRAEQVASAPPGWRVTDLSGLFSHKPGQLLVGKD